MVSIVALLVALLLPALGRAKQAANATVCATRQRQLVYPVNTYADDHKEYWPWGTTANPLDPGYPYNLSDVAEYAYPFLFAPYMNMKAFNGTTPAIGGYGSAPPGVGIGPAFHCTSDARILDASPWQVSRLTITYNMAVMNRWAFLNGMVTGGGYGPTITLKQYRRTEFTRLSKTFLYTCSFNAFPAQTQREGWRGSPNSPYPASNFYSVNWEAHLGAANVMFLDGHLKHYGEWTDLRANP